MVVMELQVIRRPGQYRAFFQSLSPYSSKRRRTHLFLPPSKSTEEGRYLLSVGRFAEAVEHRIFFEKRSQGAASVPGNSRDHGKWGDKWFRYGGF